METSFGAPTFLNFGRDYAGARDDYVYFFSHDNNSAYKPADRMVLGRVRKTHVKDRDAYEFFGGITTGGDATWSKNIADRSAVFEHAGGCYRNGITFNAGLRRYFISSGS